jgi:hypothetical protein
MAPCNPDAYLIKLNAWSCSQVAQVLQYVNLHALDVLQDGSTQC